MNPSTSIDYKLDMKKFCCPVKNPKLRVENGHIFVKEQARWGSQLNLEEKIRRYISAHWFQIFNEGSPYYFIGWEVIKNSPDISKCEALQNRITSILGTLERHTIEYFDALKPNFQTFSNVEEVLNVYGSPKKAWNKFLKRVEKYGVSYWSKESKKRPTVAKIIDAFAASKILWKSHTLLR